MECRQGAGELEGTMSWTLKYAILTVVATLVIAPALWLNLKASAKSFAAGALRYASYALLFLGTGLAIVGLTLLALQVL